MTIFETIAIFIFQYTALRAHTSTSIVNKWYALFLTYLIYCTLFCPTGMRTKVLKSSSINDFMNRLATQPGAEGKATKNLMRCYLSTKLLSFPIKNWWKKIERQKVFLLVMRAQHQQFIPGINPMNGVQACIYKLVNTSIFEATCSCL